MRKFLKFCALFLALSVCMSTAAISVAADTTAFIDVEESDYFYPAVQWGVEEGITYGVGGNLFDTNGYVTRAQIVTFLWRMAGKPAPTATETFSDVEAGSWYEAAVQWAVENGITVGTGEGMFSPDLTCNRAMCITLLYRMMGAPMDGIDMTPREEVTDEAALENMTLEDIGISFIVALVNAFREDKVFADVPEGSYFELPVFWGLLNGIITEDNSGITEENTLFRSAEPCVRKEMISFLYQTKLMQDMANAPAEAYFDENAVPVPQEYFDRLYFYYYSVVDEETGDELLLAVSEKASIEAAEAMGEEETEGIGELFRIVKVSEDRLHELLCGDMSGIRTILKNESGEYYLICCPTDVRYMRETNEKMYEDIDEWTELNGWAANICNDIVEYNDGLSAVNYTNTLLDMYLARIAYGKDIKYTISTTEYGPLNSDKVDGTRYAEYLLGGNFEMVEDMEAPDGEYVVLNFPDEGVRYDFFTADENLVREVRDDYEFLYRRVLPGSVTNTEAMQSWYLAIAEQTGKKEDYKEIDPFLGEWREEQAGRGVLTVTKSVGLAKADIEARWPGSAFEVSEWSITANLTHDGKLVYYDGKQTVTQYDENGNGTVVSEAKDANGVFELTEDGKLIWQIGDWDEPSTFVRVD